MRYKKGDIVIHGFPFSDLTRIKKRPALIISAKSFFRVLLPDHPKHKIEIGTIFHMPAQKSDKYLPLQSCIRLHKIFLLNESLIISKNTAVNTGFLDLVTEKITNLIK